MGIQMMKYTRTDDYYILFAKMERDIVTVHAVLPFERHDYLYGRMPVIRIFFIIGIVVKEKGRVLFKTDRFLNTVKDLYHLLLYPSTYSYIFNELLITNFCNKNDTIKVKKRKGANDFTA